MRTVVILMLLKLPMTAMAQVALRNVELLTGFNITRPVETMHFHEQVPLHAFKDVRALPGWQLGALAHVGTKGAMLKTGLITIFRQYDRSSLLGYMDTNNDWVWSVNSKKSEFFDLEVPLAVAWNIRINATNNISPVLGVIPGFRLYEKHTFRHQYLFPNGTDSLAVVPVRSRHNDSGPFNRLSAYAGVQWQFAVNSRTFFIEPHVRFNALPLFQRVRTIPETISYGLNMGMLLKKR